MEISLAAEPILYIGSFPVTNTLIVSVTIGALFFVSSIFIKRRLKIIPGALQNLVEYVLESLFDLIDGVTQNREETKRFFPIVASIFLFVIISSWVELVPRLGTIGVNATHREKTILIPFLRSASADLNVTLAIALVSVLATQLMGIAAIGAIKYAKKFCQPVSQTIFNRDIRRYAGTYGRNI